MNIHKPYTVLKVVYWFSNGIDHGRIWELGKILKSVHKKFETTSFYSKIAVKYILLYKKQYYIWRIPVIQ